MKKIKKPISVLLSVLMIVSLFSIVPVTADAAIVTDTGLAVGAGGSLYTIITAFLQCPPGMSRSMLCSYKSITASLQPKRRTAPSPRLRPRIKKIPSP